MQPAIAHSKAIEGPTAVIFNQYIALFHEVGENGTCLRMLEVEGNAELVAQTVDGGDRYVIRASADQACAIRPKVGSIFAAGVSDWPDFPL